MYRQVTLLALFFVIVGLRFLVAAPLVSLQTREFVASAVSTPCLLVAWEPGHRVYYTVFTYADDHGQPTRIGPIQPKTRRRFGWAAG